MILDYCFYRSNEAARDDFTPEAGHTRSIVVISSHLEHFISYSTENCCCLPPHGFRASESYPAAGMVASFGLASSQASSPGYIERREESLADLIMDIEQRIHEAVSKEFVGIRSLAARYDYLPSGSSNDAGVGASCEKPGRNTCAPRGAETPIARFSALITEHVDDEGGVVTREGFPGKRADLSSDVRLEFVRLFADREDGLQEWELRAAWHKDSPKTIHSMVHEVNKQLKKVGLRIKGAKHKPYKLISISEQTNTPESPGTATK